MTLTLNQCFSKSFKELLLKRISKKGHISVGQFPGEFFYNAHVIEAIILKLVNKVARYIDAATVNRGVVSAKVSSHLKHIIKETLKLFCFTSYNPDLRTEIVGQHS